jgi:sigma-B regulation protein RsbU (phosphoserine phosphatase)
MTVRMIPATPSGRRRLLYLAAVLFGAASAFYSIVWLHYVPQTAATRIGAEFTYSLASHALRVTRVFPEQNAEQAGLRPGDEILAINNAKLDTLTPYYEAVGRGRPGATVNFSVRRPGEASPRVVPVVLDSLLRPFGIYQDLTPGRVIAVRIMESYPFLFLVVGLAVLFLKIEDRNAWLLALVFAGFIALPDIPPAVIHPAFRWFLMSYHVVLEDLLPALLYLFLATFPAPSPLERRVPWLKTVLLAGAGASIARDLWTLTVANAYETIWLPLDYGGPTWFTPSIRALSHLYSLGGEGLAVASLIGNSFRAITPEARRKARVIVWGVACGLLPVILLVATLHLTGRRFQETPFWPYAFCVLALFLLPLSFAYAVAKHRVLEIPVLLRRSARYLLVQRGFVLLILLVSWGATVAFVLSFIRFFKSSSQLATPLGLGAGVALGAALTWGGNEAAKRGNRRIDRAFFRDAYDARVILEELGEQVRAGKDRQGLAGMLEQKISSALHPQSLAIYFETTPGRLVAQTALVAEGLEAISSDAPVLAELAHRGKPWEVPPDFGGAGLSALLGAKAECLVPILDREGRLIGLIELGPRLSEEPYSGEDKRLLASVASQAGIALESLQLAEQMAKRIEADQRASQEMEYAKQVQARLFPQKLPPMKTLEYAGGCIQARQVGGDYYDFLELRPGRLALVLADIAGKGISGALLMANLQANLRSQYAVALDDLPRLLKSVNQLFYENSSDSSYATLFFGDYDDSSRRLRYVNCGHLPPLLLRADGQLERLTATNTVLGLFEKWECSVAEVQLAAGDTLLLYTDGVTEAENPEGQEFGESRIAETLRAHRNLPVDSLLETIVATAQKFSGHEQADDITLVIAMCRS